MLRWITDFTYKIECKAAEAGTVYRLASHYYRDVIHKEAILANITDKDHILCIGGGMCPFSGILFHQITGAAVTVIDSAIACIPKARHVIERLDLGGHVHVFCQDGSSTETDLRAYSVVHLALQITPMDRVFSRVEKHAMPGTRILIRRPKKPLGGLYNQLPNPLLTSCPYVTHTKARNIGSTLLYTKQEQLQEQFHEEEMAAYGAVGCAVTDCAISA